MKLSNGSQVSVAEALVGTDSNDKPLNFRQEKDVSAPRFTAKGSDKQVYSFGLDGAITTVTVGPKPDLKKDRKEGKPIPRDKVKEVDEKIKKEKEREEKVAKGEMKPEDAAKEAAKEAEKEEQEEEAEEEKKTEPASSGNKGQRAR